MPPVSRPAATTSPFRAGCFGVAKSMWTGRPSRAFRCSTAARRNLEVSSVDYDRWRTVTRSGTGNESPVIGLGALGPGAGVAANRAFAAARRDAPPAALVAVARMSSDIPGLALQNADHFRVPFGPPALQVETRHEARLQAAAEGGDEIRLTADVAFEPALGWNGLHPDQRRRSALAPFVVVTPKSSWWVSTAERRGRHSPSGLRLSGTSRRTDPTGT